jgi:hypothetical protein
VNLSQRIQRAQRTLAIEPLDARRKHTRPWLMRISSPLAVQAVQHVTAAQRIGESYCKVTMDNPTIPPCRDYW